MEVFLLVHNSDNHVVSGYLKREDAEKARIYLLQRLKCPVAAYSINPLILH